MNKQDATELLYNVMRDGDEKDCKLRQEIEDWINDGSISNKTTLLQLVKDWNEYIGSTCKFLPIAQVDNFIIFYDSYRKRYTASGTGNDGAYDIGYHDARCQKDALEKATTQIRELFGRWTYRKLCEEFDRIMLWPERHEQAERQLAMWLDILTEAKWTEEEWREMSTKN